MLALLPFAMGVSAANMLVGGAVVSATCLAGVALWRGARPLIVVAAVPWVACAVAVYFAGLRPSGAVLLALPGSLLLARAAGMFQGEG